tara:strand:- start:246 stop:824 length:579 start_codon:yes stop_codon:yes gene_type:complete
MPNYLKLFAKGFERRFLLDYQINIKNTDIDVIVCSPGGCGNVSLNNYLEKYCISNNYLKKNSIQRSGMMHIPKPLNSMIEKRIKIILLKRDFEEIYESHKKRGFLRNSLIWYGDMFSFFRYKNEKFIKQKFLKYLKKYYYSWSKYPDELKLEIEYKDLWNSADKIGNFINIKSPEFKKNFPDYKPYEYNKSY